MQQERRKAQRTRLSGASVVYESTRYEPREAELFDIGTGGLFIPAVTPLPPGTRLAMEIRLSRGGSPFAALGRVLWTRATPAAGRPSGMGIKIVDMDEGALEAIQRAMGPAAPARERTVRGVGTPTPPAVWVAKAPAVNARGTRRGSDAAGTGDGRWRAMAAVLLVAAVVAVTFGVMRIRAMQGQGVAAATFAVVQPPGPSPAEPSAPVSAPSASPVEPAAVAPAAVAPSAEVPRAPASASKPASRPGSRPAPWRGWTPPKRPAGAPSDNPY